MRLWLYRHRLWASSLSNCFGAIICLSEKSLIPRALPRSRPLFRSRPRALKYGAENSNRPKPYAPNPTSMQVTSLGEGGGVDVACGRGHTVCVSGRRVYAWGDEQCGGGGRWVPGEVDGAFWAVAVSCGCNFTAALSVDGEVFTWGKVTRTIPPFEKN